MAESSPGQGAPLTGAAVEAALRGTSDPAEICARVERLYARIGQRFAVSTAEALVAALEQALLGAERDARSRIEGWAERHAEGGGPAALWVRARLLGGSARAARAWDACLAALPGVVPEGLLHRSRARLRAGDASGAAADLRLALQQPAGYELWARAEKLERRVSAHHDLPALRSLRLAVLSGKASIALLTPLLRLACFRDGIAVELYESDYDHWQQEILDPASGLYAFRPDVVLLPTHWRDALLPAHVPDGEAAVDEVVGRFGDLWATLRARHPCTVVAHSFDLPSEDPYGRLGTALPGGRGAMLRAANLRLAQEAARSGVLLLDLEAVALEVGAPGWCATRGWYSARQHPAPAGLLRLVEHQAALLRAILGLSRKVAILDLDNTLWGGVVGEDGLHGIELGPPSAVGEAFQAFQGHLKELRQRGVLLAVCSKNNPEDAREPFEKHPETILTLDDFVVFEANWEEKASNLRRIAETLSLGTDSFVFLDDNPVERAWIRAQMPEVLVPELPSDPAGYIEALERLRPFEAIALSEEDQQRHESYRAEVQRQQLRTRTTSLEEFLADLDMVARHGPFDEANLPRIAQLVNKTNQFNLTTIRYTEEQLRAQGRDPRWWTRWFRLQDRFLDNGLVGVLTCRPPAGDDEALEIDNWLMSCRVLGRKLEDFMLRTVVEHCRTRAVRRLYGRYVPTAKNSQVSDLYSRLGFALRPSGEGNGTFWVLDVEDVQLPDVPIAAAAE